jgi:pyruvate-ferredoxin/flavodoxin oxidoreductase
MNEAWQGSLPKMCGGRYGLSSKEFTPAMAVGVFDELRRESPKSHFTVGIRDDVTGLSIEAGTVEPSLPPKVHEAVFFGLGSDGTVGANKNTIKIIGHETSNFVQGYFVYDSKKSGAVTVSHLRIGPEAFEAPYLIEQADFVACHQFDFLFMQRVRIPARRMRARDAQGFLGQSPPLARRGSGRWGFVTAAAVERAMLRWWIHGEEN